MEQTVFNNIVRTEAQLRDLIGEPSALAIRKQLNFLDSHICSFIALSPFLLIGTADEHGSCDVSPRGDAPGFVAVLDKKTLIIPERPGNRRIDSLRNILQTGSVGLLFAVPGFEETLRINGKAVLTVDPHILDRLVSRGKRPKIAIGVTVEEAFFQCAKALKRSSLWNTETWPNRTCFPSLAQILMDQAQPSQKSVDDLERDLAESYTKSLY